MNNEIVLHTTIRKRLLRSLLLLLVMCGGSANTVLADGVVIRGSVYGGGNAASVGTAGQNTKDSVNITGTNATVEGEVYGGCNSEGSVIGNVVVTITAGTIGTASGENEPVKNVVFGGGKGQSTLIEGNVEVNIGRTGQATGGATINGSVYGGSALGLVNARKSGYDTLAVARSKTDVNINSGTIRGDIYGGGLGSLGEGNNVSANVYGTVTVNIGAVDGNTYSGNATINGSVYGCNNLNGTPKGDVTVNVYKTAHKTAHNETNAYPTENDNTDDDTEVNQLSELAALVTNHETDGYSSKFAIAAVYGGGNQAAYRPVSETTDTTTVHVFACNENTIQTVYGGGNAADATNVRVIIEGGFIDRVFGGGNGYSATNNHNDPTAPNYNPGAKVTGSATTQIHGGLFRQVFGGSNQYGNVAKAELLIDNASGCTELIHESFGGANEAEISGDLTTTLACSQNQIGSFYGGSNLADINGNVTLNVYGGTYTNVFGGSKGIAGTPGHPANIYGDVTLNLYGGTMDNAFGGSDDNGNISGKITVNVIDKGACDLTVNNIYGGGRNAAYTPTYTVDEGEARVSPEVNLIHGTVANVYGGALGATATVTANPLVNIGYDATVMSNLEAIGDLDATEFNAHVTGNVYGGGDAAAVTGSTQVNLRKANSVVGGSVFGGGNLADISNRTAVNIYDGTVTDVYGGGALANVGTNASDSTKVTITGGTVSNVYGGGLGRLAVEDDPATTDVDETAGAIAALVNGAVTVNVNGGTVAKVFGCNNINGAPQSTVQVNIEQNAAAMAVSDVYGGGNQAAYTGSPVVNVKNGTVSGRVFGGGLGKTAVVTGNPVVNIGDLTEGHDSYAAIVTGNVYGGGDEAAVTGNTSVTLQKANSSVSNLFGGGNAASISGNTVVDMTSGTVTAAVYGGCNTSGTVGGTSTVTVTGGTISAAFTSEPASIPQVLFGGGKGADTSVTGKATVNVGTLTDDTYAGTANIYGNVYGGSENGEVHAVDVNLYGNTIYGNVFGGGYQTAAEKTAATDVNVILDGTKFDRTYDNTAQIFGCNNLVGTPLGQVNVHVFRTVATDGYTGDYHVAAVYGGGNEADYVPTASGVGSTQVIIEGCNRTSIKDVYGGGNAAAVPGTEVWILGSTIIDNVYGGGNGELGAASAAHVGFHRDSETTKHDYTSGTGKTEVFLVAGTINNVYGGSNSNGDIRKGADVKTATLADYTAKFTDAPTPNYCDKLVTQHIYGGGSQAEMSGDVNVILECMPEDYVDAVYGGAANATINGNVSLTVTSGKFGRVFGGNNDGGSINGTITVNVYEDGCEPLIIGELYGAGNNAPYSIYGCTPPAANSPEGTPWTPNTEAPQGEDPNVKADTIAVSVNVFSCTSIGKVYGGGKGETAQVIGNTHVWINMLNGIVDGTPKTDIGKIGQVFGGGSAADVIGNTIIDVGTATVHPNIDNEELIGVNIKPDTDYLSSTSNTSIEITEAGIYGGGEAADVDGNTTLNIGTKDLSEGTNITGNIYGGGLGSGTHVTGDVTVNIGGQDAETAKYVGYATITGDVYGGSAMGKVNSKSVNSEETPQEGKTTQVNLYGGTITGNVYGGGLGNNDHAADVYGPVMVNVYGGTAHNVFGCNNVNGAPQNTVAVNINGTDNISDDIPYPIVNVYGGGNLAAYAGTPAVTMNAGTVDKIYGGGLGSTASVGGTNVTMANSTPTPKGSMVNYLFGGGEEAPVTGNVSVNVTGGTVYDDVYGGGALAQTNTGNWNQGSDPAEKYVDITDTLATGRSLAGYYTKSNDTYTIIRTDAKKEAGSSTRYYKKFVGGTWQEGYNNETTGTTYKTEVTLTGGVVGNVYGGGLGDAHHAANVYGDVKVTINDPERLKQRLNILDDADIEALALEGGVGVGFTQRSSEEFTIGSSTTLHTVSVTGHVFGCNNINGSPTGNVLVHVYSTRQIDDDGNIIAGHIPAETNDESERYEIQGVYGGGNLADYLPAVGKNTKVQIDGCNITSIKKVYGGGNSALVPESDVLITGSYAIGYAFGGGNGGDYIKKNDTWQDNEGAIVIGTAKIACHGGKVGSVFGGSDAKGVCGGTSIDTNAAGDCALKITRIYGAGNEADVNGDVNTIISGCTSNEVEYVHGGSYNANVSGNVTLTITSGILQNVYGGNDARGSIGGNITVNIEETETSCEKPIIIQNLVGGGNNAPYPGTNRNGVDLSQNSDWHGKITVNVKSATRIDNVYGGCFNAQANADTVVVNINMVKGRMAGKTGVSIPKRYAVNGVATIPNITYTGTGGTDNILCTIKDEIGTIGNVYGGGKEGRVVGHAKVNIGTSETVDIMARNEKGQIIDTNGAPITYQSGQNMGNVQIKYTPEDVVGAHITDSVYGGGELADVTGNTYVNISAVTDGTDTLAVTGLSVTIGGSVFGGGKGIEDSFLCIKAMVGINNDGIANPDGGTNVIIGNGSVSGNVYGGGKIGRVEKNTLVMIGTRTGDSAPVIGGNVFGAGKGLDTHGYSALVRGNPTVTVQGGAKVLGSVYGGGEIASVGRYKVKKKDGDPEDAPNWLPNGMPYSLANNNSGICKVIIRGNAVVGPDEAMLMTKAGGPDFKGNVFGAGQGVLPTVYSYDSKNKMPKRMMLYDAASYNESNRSSWDWADTRDHSNVWEYFDTEEKYLTFVETLALATQTEVTVGGNAFVKGSVYGGSEDGTVQHNTIVNIQETCQIGAGYKDGTAQDKYSESAFINPATTSVTDGNALAECASWPYGQAATKKYAPYDEFANDYTSYASTIGDDGHTYYGNVFGGGSGKDPYAPGKWHWKAGSVGGNTAVNITGGHILTNVYGGNELTNVGSTGDITTGKCTITMTGGTIGVPRTLAQIEAHPVTCYIFGAGKGDQRIFFNKQTNVQDVELNITGGTIYGSVFGGGEDGHVLRDVQITIGKNDGTRPLIGTWGTSYVDGNVFGGGRGFGGDAYTAGNVAGSVDLKIKGGTMLGSIYGGGRLGSVGYGLFDAGVDGYGEMRADTDTEEGFSTSEFFKHGRGYVNIDISGGTIGNDHEFVYTPVSANTPKTLFEDGKLAHTKGGNVFAGGMGRREKLDGTTAISLETDGIDWHKLGNVKSTKLTISGSNTLIKGNVYGGGEFGAVTGTHSTKNTKNEDIDVSTEIIISGGTIGTIMGIMGEGDSRYSFGSVYGGGYGTEADVMETRYTTDVEKFGALVRGNTYIDISGDDTKILASVYGGGEMAGVTDSTYVNVSGGEIGVDEVKTSEDPVMGKYYVLFGGYRMGNVYGGGKGSTNAVLSGIVKGNTNVNISGGSVYHNVYGGGALSSVGTFSLSTDANKGDYGVPFANVPVNWTAGGTATVSITGGTIGINGHDNGMVNGSSRGGIATNKPNASESDPYDHLAWVNNTVVNIGDSITHTGPAIKGSVYGGGENGHNYGNAVVNIHGGTIGVEDNTLPEDDTWSNRGNVYGAGCGTDTYNESTETQHWHNPMGGCVRGTSELNIDGGHVMRSVYGGGSMGSVSGKATVNIIGGRIGIDGLANSQGETNGNVFGGPKGDILNAGSKPYVAESEVNINYSTTPSADSDSNDEKLIVNSVYGGGEAGIVKGNVAVNMKGGLVLKDVYGGGALADTNTDSGEETKYGTTVALTGGRISGDAYGGGLGRKTGINGATDNIAAVVHGDIDVTLNGTAFDVTYEDTTDPLSEGEGFVKVVKSGRVFGTNNLCGSPLGNATVTVYKTVQGNTPRTHEDKKTSETPSDHSYELAAVYGGGNLAAYETEGKKPHVIIHGCDDTSIETVYGGGNAAAVTETDVDIFSVYEIGSVFGGGNGNDKYKTDDGWQENPGADVHGSASTMIYGGTVHEAYGGSNTKGTITGTVAIDVSSENPDNCQLVVDKIVGAGKNADVEGDIIVVLECKQEAKIPLLYAGADNANVKGNVEYTIRSGNFGKVFGGNNLGGAIFGHIKLNIEETGGCGTPINIDELYLGGNQAAYSKYGYYVETASDGRTPFLTSDGKFIFRPRRTAADEHKPVKTYNYESKTWWNYPETGENVFTPYDEPELNIVSCTSIGEVFGGGYGEYAVMYANPTVNINMIQGAFANDKEKGVPKVMADKELTLEDNPNKLGIIGDVFGGGDAANVWGNTTVNIGTAQKVKLHLSLDNNHDYVMSTDQNVLGAYITGSVYGGGKLANVGDYELVTTGGVTNDSILVAGNTYVNICAQKQADTYNVITLAQGASVSIGGSVYGGGQGEAKESGSDAFRCGKAMVTGGTNVVIANSTVHGSVYGGGEKGRVEENTMVTIGLGEGGATPTSAPVIKGYVFGAGQGVATHGYSGLVRGNSTVTVQGDAKVERSIYGGGEMATVGRYKVVGGIPTEPTGGGKCTVTVGGYAEIGTNDMKMTNESGPTDWGHVFGAGKGVAPYKDIVGTPWSVSVDNSKKEYADTTAYLSFLETLALASETDVTIGKHAFVKGSVYGGSENGRVQTNTLVKIKEDCQIGNGDGVNRRYTPDEWAYDGSTADKSLSECASWTFVSPYAPYDPFANATGNLDQYSDGSSTSGGRRIASDGHSFYGNVFGGGSGAVPYAPAKYFRAAGFVGGDTRVEISGGHILTNVYGGNETTDVAGTARITMTAGTIGVPRTDEQILAHPLTGYIFGAGKGDERIFFNKETNVNHAVVTVEGGRIYGSVYGGGEDGHVLTNDTVIIGKANGSGPVIGTRGTSYYDGNVFGGGRGLGGEALTAGNVGGSVKVDIKGGTMLGSVYGGGRLASVGYGLYLVDEEVGGVKPYGVMRPEETCGNVVVAISGGIIGNDVTNAQYGGNVFGGSMGRLTKLSGAPADWERLASVKNTTVSVTGGRIYRSVYGGGEMGTVTSNTEVTVTGGTIGTEEKGGALFGNVYGGGMGYVDPAGSNYLKAGLVKGTTTVNIENGTSTSPTIYHNIYGGGAYGSVGTFDLSTDDNKATYHAPYAGMPVNWTANTGTTYVNIKGGTIGTNGHENGMVYGSSRGDVGAPGEIHDKLAWVYDAHVTIGTEGQGKTLTTPLVKGSVYGSGENGHTYHNTEVTVHSGMIGITDTSIDGGAAYGYRGNVYGGGCGTDKYYTNTTGVDNPHDGNGDRFNALAGIVYGNTQVTVDGGQVVHNVYGAGAMGSVGHLDDSQTVFHNSGDTDHTTFYDFGMSWPVKFVYTEDATSTETDKVTGKTKVVVKGNAQVTGRVFGAARGDVKVGVNDITTHRYEEAKYANVRTAEVIIGTGSDTPAIGSSVYGGGEDGHVYEDASVTINSGTIARSVFGGGKGESTYEATLWEPLSSAPNDQTQHQEKSSPEPVHSWTAGKVYGNTTVTMNGGSVGYFIYGGGNLGSVGKGNYAGGADDYSKAGYGELPSASGSLWTNTDFTGSGVSTVNLLGGTVGDANGVTVGNNSNVSYDEDGIPYGSVFGGCRGTAAMDVGARSPRYRYVPDFFMGYVNKSVINIGGYIENGDTIVTSDDPEIYGSVYGGGQDGHVRNSSAVNIFKGTIAGQNSTIDTSGRSGHVFGAGSGIGTYHEGGVDKCSFSSGSVTGTSTVAVSGGSIAGNIYGGGAMASVGPPKTGQPLDEQKAATNDTKSYSYTKVDIKGGTIGGSIYGASRGPSDAFRKTAFTDKGIDYDPTKFATDIWSDVLISGGTISGSVYGGGETGQVKCGVNVNILGGNIETDVYGGGALANTNTSNLKQERGTNYWLWTDKSRTAKYTTTVNLLGGAIGGDAYGGGLGRKAADNVEAVEAKVYGDVKVNLNGLEAADYVASTHGTLTTGESARLEQLSSVGYQIKDAAKGAVVSRVFGCNNLNGSPQGKVRVHVFGTQNGNSGKTKITDKTQSDYDVAAVYGGGNLAAYVPMGPAAPGTNATTIVDDYKHTTQRAEVIIDGCHRTSIKQVYGGGNAASAPATFVEVNGTYEIDEVFGGGNGADEYSLVEGGVTKWYQNPGANVGYENFTTVNKSTEGHDGSTKEKAYPADTKLDASTKGLRQANYAYGSGAATTDIKGGKIHVVYGGSNKKGNISITALSMYESMYDDCPMDVDESYGGGKDAPIDGTIDVRLSCAHGVKEIFGGAKNADVNSDINLTITNGSSLERVFGGNNTSGAIAGSITVNIEEGGCEPIKIKELYAGGYLAPYSIYGYQDDGRGGYVNETIDYGGTIGTISQRKTLSKSDWETFKAQLQTFITEDSTTLAGKTDEQIAADPTLQEKAVQLAALRERISSYPKKDPRINVISATRIDTIYGGGYQALVVGSPHVNVNMTNGKVEVKEVGSGDGQSWKDADGNSYTTERTTETTGEGTEARTKYYTTLPIGTIGSIFGGGNLADIDGDTYVEIGTGKWLNADDVWETKDTLGVVYKYNDSTRKWDYEIQDLENATTVTYSVNTMPTPARNAATIDDNVFGGGKGAANSFTCEKAMIGVNNEGEGATDPVGGTSVAIANGTVGGSVYGGGMIGRVEKNTMVTIGIDPIEGIRPEKFSPIIRGNVFGAGMGVETHGYSGLVRGNSTVTILGEAKVESSVYGGGEKASVGRYWIASSPKEATQHGVEVGMPYDLKNGGTCTVIVRGNAEIGPDSMKMERYDDEAKPLPPDDTGYVFGGGKGVSPYDTATPGRYYMDNGTYTWESYAEDSKEEDYLKYTNTLGIANKTNVTIGGNAFVKGSVYGGSENGHVRVDTHVTIADNCQIGNGEGVNRRYTDEEWSNGCLVEQSELEHEIAQTYSSSLPECAHWPYGLDTDNDGKKDLFAPYDKFADADGKYEDGTSADEGRPTASDGHTFFGNVFGGGSGYYPYKPGKWHRAEGSVGGNTYVNITGGHILTNVYGGNEMTDVEGNCYVTMTGGSIGVPRTLEEIADHPVTCYLFGAGKGDQRIFFNTSTNVKNAIVQIAGNARIYGSVFGGGEDGHVLENDTVIISDGTTDKSNIRYPYIGTTGTSYVDGNVFGAGRGFSGEALTAGSVGQNVVVNISDGTMLGSLYGGGRLASVGTDFANVNDVAHYGHFEEDTDEKTYGHVKVNISGGTIGNVNASGEGAKYSGNVFGGSMGRLTLLDGSIAKMWPQLGQVKTTEINITGSAVITRNVYGGGELGTVRDSSYITIGGTRNADGTISPQDEDEGIPVIGRDLYGGGYGSNDNSPASQAFIEPDGTTIYRYTPMQWSGLVGQGTHINILGGRVKKSVYGGGEMASVGVIDYRITEDANGDITYNNKKYKYSGIVMHADENNSFALSWPYELSYIPGYKGSTHINITGGRIGLTGVEDKNNPFVGDKDNGDVYGGGKGLAGNRYDMVFCANVGSAEININYKDSTATPNNYMYMDNVDVDCVAGAVYGGGENGHVIGDTYVTLTNGLIGHSLYGGGSGKGKYTMRLLKIGATQGTTNPADSIPRDIYSITAGKVYGNTHIKMEGGYVVRNIYGGGNMGSVGKGNYAGAKDDFSWYADGTYNGYGEKLVNDSLLWTPNNYDPSQPISESNKPNNAWHFLNSGKAEVEISGGTIGYIDDNPEVSTKDGLPYGNVFGGCRGESAPNIGEPQRYYYSPEFFSGYANETKVVIGDSTNTDESYKGPTILGSVYGGGQDGHVRRDAHVIVVNGEIGLTFDKNTTDKTNVNKLKTEDPNHTQWLHRGNVFGAGSGIGKYRFDFNNNKEIDETGTTYSYTNPQTERTSQVKEVDYSSSAGSVTRFTKVEVKGGTIHRNVYGGGSLSSVGPPKIPPTRTDGDGFHPDDETHKDDVGRQTLNEVVIGGMKVAGKVVLTYIGDATSHAAGYGGNVFGASRGDLSIGDSYGTSVWTKVFVKDGSTILGNVFGGGDNGMVKQDSEVIIGEAKAETTSGQEPGQGEGD